MDLDPRIQGGTPLRPTKRRSARRKGRGPKSLFERLDDRYQRFVQRYVDNVLTSSARREQSSEFDVRTSEKEVSINRKLGICTVSTTAAVIGVAGLPVLSQLGIVIGAGLAGYLSLDLAIRYAIRSWKERRLKYIFVGSGIAAAMLAAGLYVLAANIAMIVFYAVFKVAARTEASTHAAMRRAFGLQPPAAVWALVDGVEVEIRFDELQIGDLVVVKAGQTIPIDGTVMAGDGAVDQHVLTGEATPIDKSVGDPVLANTLLTVGRLEVRVEKAGSDTVASQIGKILIEASTADLASTAKTERFVDRLTPALIATSGLSFLTLGPAGPIAIFNAGFATPLMSGPLNMLTYLNIASKRGILIKDGASLERLRKVDTVIFDKTGTLTIEEPSIAEIHRIDGWSQDDVLRLAALGEHRQTHPIARAIVGAAKAQGLELEVPETAAYAVGMGIEVTIGERMVRIGSRRFMDKHCVMMPSVAADWHDAAQEVGGSLVYVSVNQACIGAIRLATQLRPEARDLIHKLHDRDMETHILSGDHRRPTEHLADLLGVGGVFAEVLPTDKAQVIKDLQAAGRTVLFVGDGINDALALQQADVSVSMRGATTLATDNAQVVLMSPDLSPINDLLDLGQTFDHNLKRTLACAFVPAGTVVGGVLLLGLSVPGAITLCGIGIVTSVSAALAPLREDHSAPETKAIKSYTNKQK